MNSDEIRRLVRAALTEALGKPDKGSPDKDDGAIAVTIGNDAELMAFAREVAGNAKAVRSGKLTYRLARSQKMPAAGGGGGYRWEHGVLNEVRIIEISKTHSRVLLRPGAVVTPLARDKARQVKLELVKERS